jgi:hypothetical protein
MAFSAGYAQDQQQKPADQASPSGHEMMGNREMAGQMQRMKENPEMAAEMKRMMENCNKMMESMMQQKPAPAPEPEKKG